MRRVGRTGAALAAVAALATVPQAMAKPDGSHGHGAEHGPKGVSYVFKGTYVDSTTVDVSKGNKHVRRAELVGGPVSFDFSTSKISVADTNGDGTADLADVVAGDKVVVKVKAPKADPGPQPLAARQLVDQTSPAAEDAEEAPEA